MNTPSRLPSPDTHNIWLRTRAAMYTTIAAADVWQFVLLWGPCSAEHAEQCLNPPLNVKKESLESRRTSADTNFTFVSRHLNADYSGIPLMFSASRLQTRPSNKLLLRQTTWNRLCTV